MGSIKKNVPCSLYVIPFSIIIIHSFGRRWTTMLRNIVADGFREWNLCFTRITEYEHKTAMMTYIIFLSFAARASVDLVFSYVVVTFVYSVRCRWVSSCAQFQWKRKIQSHKKKQTYIEWIMRAKHCAMQKKNLYYIYDQTWISQNLNIKRHVCNCLRCQINDYY